MTTAVDLIETMGKGLSSEELELTVKLLVRQLNQSLPEPRFTLTEKGGAPPLFSGGLKEKRWVPKHDRQPFWLRRIDAINMDRLRASGNLSCIEPGGRDSDSIFRQITEVGTAPEGTLWLAGRSDYRSGKVSSLTLLQTKRGHTTQVNEIIHDLPPAWLKKWGEEKGLVLENVAILTGPHRDGTEFWSEYSDLRITHPFIAGLDGTARGAIFAYLLSNPVKFDDLFKSAA